MSTCVALSARWCTLITRCTMGISRPSVLNTTAGRGGRGGTQVCSQGEEGWGGWGGGRRRCRAEQQSPAPAQRTPISPAPQPPQRPGSKPQPKPGPHPPRTDVPRVHGALRLVQEEDVAAVEARLHAAAQHHHHLRGGSRSGVGWGSEGSIASAAAAGWQGARRAPPLLACSCAPAVPCSPAGTPPRSHSSWRWMPRRPTSGRPQQASKAAAGQRASSRSSSGSGGGTRRRLAAGAQHQRLPDHQGAGDDHACRVANVGTTMMQAGARVGRQSAGDAAATERSRRACAAAAAPRLMVCSRNCRLFMRPMSARKSMVARITSSSSHQAACRRAAVDRRWRRRVARRQAGRLAGPCSAVAQAPGERDRLYFRTC